jgi:hypothetical protein
MKVIKNLIRMVLIVLKLSIETIIKMKNYRITLT